MELRSFPRPEPAAGVQAYRNELARRLGADARCRENYEAWKANPRAARPDYLPIRLDVENVSRCNFACTMCAVSKWPKGKRAEDMTLEQFRHLLDEQYGVVEIKMNGLGEPLMGKDYFAMISAARERHIWVRMTTNASLLHLKDNYKGLLDSGVNDIDISVDGATAEVFEAIRVQGDFDRVTKNCRLLNEECARRGIARTKMWTLVQRGNRAKLLDHVALAADLGFRHMIFSVQLHGWGDPALAARNVGEQRDLTHEQATLLVDAGRIRGVRVAFWDVSDKFTRKNLCPWPFERAVVTSDLRTVPCCMIGNPDAFEIGHGEPLAEVWAGTEYADFRDGHLTGKLPDVCRACYKEED